MSKYIGDVSAYAYAVSKGYTGTEEEFAELMADYAEVGQRAEDAAENALNSKTAAQTAATTATNKASEATTAAQTATNKAAEAQADADAAALDASQALSAASTATSKATEATTAAATATSAATTATTAKDDAVSAKTAAETAQAGAETAAASVQSSAAQITQNTSDISELKEDFATMESDGVVPSADQILTDKGVTDSVPYHYRKTGGDGSDRLYDQIVGGTVCFNQLAHDFINREETLGITITVDNTKGSITASGTATATNNLYFMTPLRCIQDHKYLFKGSKGRGWLGVSSTSAKDTGNGAIFNATAGMAGDNQFVYGFSTGDVINETLYPQIFDLTAMFGSTIADYIYSLETDHIGDGVAFFKSLFPNGYYPYDSGTLKSVEGLSEHKMVGFNQFDGEWQVGVLLQDGTIGTSETTRRTTKNYIKLVPNETYCIRIPGSGRGRGAFYDANKNLVSYYADFPATGNNAVFPNNGAFVSKDGAYYFIFVAPTTACWLKYCLPGLNLTKICINISDPLRNGTYEPYEEHSYPLDDSLTLRGIPTLVDGKIKWDGDLYAPSGKVKRRYGIVDLGTMTWSKTGTSTFYTTSLLSPTMATPIDGTITAGKWVCSKYLYGGGAGTGTTTKDNVICYDWNNIGSVIIFDSTKSNANPAEFKAAMSGVYLVYELATPTTETADSYVSPQICHADGTEEFVSTGIVPIGHNTKYPDNMRAKLDGLPWNFASLIAPTESTYTATRNYTTGALFIVQNVLYKATSNIANGGTITPNTNCTATTLAEIISALA